MQAPSVGRIVHFTPDSKHFVSLASIITSVNEEAGTVTLASFGSHSLYFNQGVRFSEEPTVGCWSWPPRSP